MVVAVGREIEAMGVLPVLLQKNQLGNITV